MTSSSSLDDVLSRSELHDAVAGQVASAFAFRLAQASATPPIRAGAAEGTTSAASVVVAAASRSPDGLVNSAAIAAFASAVAVRLGFEPAAEQRDVLSVVASRVASVLRGTAEFTARSDVASSVAAAVASALGARILASQVGADLVAERLTGVASAPLTRRSPLQTEG